MEEYGEYEYSQEFSAFERANQGGPLHEFLTDVKMDEKLTRSASPEDRFMVFVNAISADLKLDQRDIRKMLSVVEEHRINHIAYRNPAVFVLGFIATNGGSNLISKRNVERVFGMLDKFKTSEITRPDVVRYMRFWMTLNGNLSTMEIVD